MKTLVTGANGLIGANLVRGLLTDGHSVRALVRPTSDRRSLDGLDVECVTGDVLDRESVETTARGCEIVFHTAAVFAYWGHTAETLENVAVGGTRTVLEAAARAGVQRVVLTSSSVVLGSSTQTTLRDETDTLSEAVEPPYCHAKAAQEREAFTLASQLGLELVAVCPTITVGPHDTRLGPSNAVIVNYLSDPFRTTWPGGCNVVSVQDVARGHILAAQKGRAGERYVLGGENWEWSLIHRTISELCGVPGPLVYGNHTSVYLAAAAQEWAARWTGRPPAATRAQARMAGRFYWYTSDKARALGYAPRPARQALAEAIAWLAGSPHVSRALRSTLRLSREVHDARRNI